MIKVPKSWFPDLRKLNLLCLASAGGQQAPILAAAGANVTVMDNSPAMLAQDQAVAKREALDLALFQGDMADLSQFEDGSFDLIFHPVSNLFVPSIQPVWNECFRVLKPGGDLLAGFCNPIRYIFDQKLEREEHILRAKYKLPYSDIESLTDEERQYYLKNKDPLEFSHTLEAQISGQIQAGFVITGFYEDRFENTEDDLISHYMASFIATRAHKPGTEVE
jgi:ubiquinone/menaquinone biosynthesis C-methylase UbiE